MNTKSTGAKPVSSLRRSMRALGGVVLCASTPYLLAVGIALLTGRALAGGLGSLVGLVLSILLLRYVDGEEWVGLTAGVSGVFGLLAGFLGASALAPVGALFPIRIERGVLVSDLPVHHDASGWVMRDGMPAPAYMGTHKDDEGHPYHAAPLVPSGWDRTQPVPAWVTCADGDCQKDWVAPWHAGLRWTQDTREFQGAIQDALEHHHLTSATNAPLVKWVRDPVAGIKSQVVDGIVCLGGALALTGLVALWTRLRFGWKRSKTLSVAWTGACPHDGHVKVELSRWTMAMFFFSAAALFTIVPCAFQCGTDWRSAIALSAGFGISFAVCGAMVSSLFGWEVRAHCLEVVSNFSENTRRFPWDGMSCRCLGFWIVKNRHGPVRDEEGNLYRFALIPPRFLIKNRARLEGRLRQEGLWDIEQVRLLFSPRSHGRRPPGG